MHPVCSSLLLGAGLVAQTPISSPPFFEVRDGTSAVSVAQPFSSLAPGARFQYVLGDLRGIQLANLGSLALRRDAAPGSSQARTVRMRLLMAHTDYANVTNDFARNYTDTPVEVLGAGGAPVNVDLPATSAPPSTFNILLPFATQFSYDGQRDLLIEFQVFDSNNPTPYSLDCVDGTNSVSVGASYYNGLLGCVVRPNLNPFTIFKTDPSWSNGRTTIGHYAQLGPPRAPGVLILGLSDPNTNFQGLLCTRLRALPTITVPVATGPLGEIGSAGVPFNLTFPDLGEPSTFFTQFAVLDPARPAPEVGLALSDAVRLELHPSIQLDRLRVSSFAGPTATSGEVSPRFVPVFLLDR